jgi:hypothetical protein
MMLGDGAKDSQPGHRGIIVLGVNVASADGVFYQLSISLCRAGELWKIKTEACADTEKDELQHLRRFAERTASDLPTCLQQLAAAAEDLVGLVGILS